MKIKTLLMLLITVPMYVFAQDFSEEIISPNTVDGRSLAMGNTAIVSTTGSNAIFSNPGIIATFDNRQVQAGGRLVMGSMEDERSEEYYDSYEYKLSPHFSVNHFSFSMPYALAGVNLLALAIWLYLSFQ